MLASLSARERDALHPAGRRPPGGRGDRRLGAPRTRRLTSGSRRAARLAAPPRAAPARAAPRAPRRPGLRPTQHRAGGRVRSAGSRRSGARRLPRGRPGRSWSPATAGRRHANAKNLPWGPVGRLEPNAGARGVAFNARRVVGFCQRAADAPRGSASVAAGRWVARQWAGAPASGVPPSVSGAPPLR